MTHLAPDVPVIFNGQHGTVHDVIPCGYDRRLVQIWIDVPGEDRKLVRVLESDLRVIENCRPHLATVDGKDVRDTGVSECQP